MATASIPADEKPPTIVIVPGGSQNAAHYGYLSWLLQKAGYPVCSSTLPSIGARAKVTPEDDASYVRKSMLEPILDIEGHNAIVVMHSYSGVPGSAACKGLGRSDRKAQGKTTSVLGQIFIASILNPGGDGKDLLSGFGGQFPPHLWADEENNLIRCDNPIPPLYNDIDPSLAKVLSQAAVGQCLSSFTSPCPRASWDEPSFKNRIAFIRTTRDASLPVDLQQGMIAAAGLNIIVEDIESGHCPQLSRPEELCGLVVRLVERFRGM